MHEHHRVPLDGPSGVATAERHDVHMCTGGVDNSTAQCTVITTCVFRRVMLARVGHDNCILLKRERWGRVYVSKPEDTPWVSRAGTGTV